MPDPRRRTPVGATGLELTRLSFGSATQGGLFQPVPASEAKVVFTRAWDVGVRYFDTAPWYGYGQAEERLGAFLSQKEGYVLSSKVGRLLRDVPPHPSQLDPDGATRSFASDSPLNVLYDFSYDGTMRSFEESLRRMDLDRLDILYLHDPDVMRLSVNEVMAGAGRALNELREQGVVKAIGAGMNEWEMPLAFAQTGAFDLFLLAGRYTLLEQESLPFMNYCAQNGVGVVPCSVFNSGLLTKPSPAARYNYAPVPPDVLGRALRLEGVCERHGVPLRAAAMQFPLAHPAAVSVMTAARTVAQLEDTLAMFTLDIPTALWDDLAAEGLVRGPLPRGKVV